MEHEGIEYPEGSEYHQLEQRRWWRIFGSIANKGVGGGDDGVLMLRGRVAEAPQQANSVLIRALESETVQAVSRSESFLLEINEGRLPTSLRDERVLMDVSSVDLRAAIQKWVALNEDSLLILSEDTETCGRYRDDISVEGLFEFCLTVTKAEESLRESLQFLFNRGPVN